MEEPLKARIPRTDSVSELARFWDTHDLTDFEDGLEEVPEPVFERSAGAAVQVHLKPEEAEIVRRMARTRGVGHEDLIREWVLEKIRLS